MSVLTHEYVISSQTVLTYDMQWGILFRIIPIVLRFCAGRVAKHVKETYDGNLEDWFWLSQVNLPPDLPILTDLHVGHTAENMVVPLGCEVMMDMNAQTLEPVGFAD